MAVHSENDYKEKTNDAVYDCIIADISIKTKLEGIKGALAHYSAFFSIFHPHALLRPIMMASHSENDYKEETNDAVLYFVKIA